MMQQEITNARDLNHEQQAANVISLRFICS